MEPDAFKYTAPVTPLEKSLVAIEQNLFDHNPIGTSEDFFMLGGNSLKAIRLIALIYAEYGIELQLGDIFETRTIQDLAKLIENRDQTVSDIPQLEKASQKSIYHLPCAVHISAPDGDFFEETYFNLGRMDILTGKLDVRALEKAMHTMIARHDALRTSFLFSEGSYWFKVADKVPFKLDFRQCNEDEARKAMQDFIRIFDVGSAPLLRAAVIQVEAEKYYFLLDMHHNIYDAEALGIFDKELWQIYRGEGLAPLPFQYTDYLVWLDTLCSRNIIEKYKDYWKQKLLGFSIARFPADQTANKPLESKRESFIITPTEYQAIDKICRAWKITRPCFIMASFMLLLAIESRQQDITLGLRISNRFDPGIDGVIGSFMEQAVLRSRFTYEENVRNFYTNVNITITEAIEYSLYPHTFFKDEIVKLNSTGITEFFSIIVNYIEYEENEFHISKDLYREKSLIVKPDHTPYDISFKIIDNHQTLKLDFKYMANLFSQGKINGLIKEFKNLMNEALVSDNNTLEELVSSAIAHP